VHGLDHQRVLPEPFCNRWQFAGFDQLRQLWRFLKCRGELGRICDDVWPFQLPDHAATHGLGQSPWLAPTSSHQRQESNGEYG
jgi:hypothetical protein